MSSKARLARIARNPARNLFVTVEILRRGMNGDKRWTRVREVATGRVYWTPELIVAA